MKSFKPKGFTMITTLKAFNEKRINENDDSFSRVSNQETWWNSLSLDTIMKLIDKYELDYVDAVEYSGLLASGQDQADEMYAKYQDGELDDILNEKDEEETITLTPQAQKFLDAIRVSDNTIELKDVTVQASDRGNWIVYHNGKKLMVVGSKMLDDATIMKYELEHHINEARKYYDRTNFSKYPYQMYFSDNGMADAVGADSIAELIDNVAKKRNLKAFAIFKADRGFHSTADEKYLTLWYDTTGHDFWTNRAVKEPELNKKKIDSLDTFYTKFDRNGKPKMPMNEALGKGLIRVFKKKEMKEYIKDVKKSEITKRSMDKIVKADHESDDYKVNYVTLKDGTKGYVWSENQKLDESMTTSKVDMTALERDMDALKVKYPDAKVTYFFAKDASGKGYVLNAKEKGKIVYTSYDAGNGKKK